MRDGQWSRGLVDVYMRQCTAVPCAVCVVCACTAVPRAVCVEVLRATLCVGCCVLPWVWGVACYFVGGLLRASLLVGCWCRVVLGLLLCLIVV